MVLAADIPDKENNASTRLVFCWINLFIGQGCGSFGLGGIDVHVVRVDQVVKVVSMVRVVKMEQYSA